MDRRVEVTPPLETNSLPVRGFASTNDPVRWVFFDIGSTLVDEEEACRHRIRDMLRDTAITFEQFWEKRIEYAKTCCIADQKTIEHFNLAKTPWHSEDEVPFTDCEQTISVLCEKGYKLGVIANQAPGTKERLDAWGLGKYFEVIAASAELGFSKPDPEIFRRALDMAGCMPEQALMVGDRLDNDIRPAKELGMRTVRIRKGIASYAEPSCEEETPDKTIGELCELLKLL